MTVLQSLGGMLLSPLIISLSFSYLFSFPFPASSLLSSSLFSHPLFFSLPLPTFALGQSDVFLEGDICLLGCTQSKESCWALTQKISILPTPFHDLVRVLFSVQSLGYDSLLSKVRFSFPSFRLAALWNTGLSVGADS